jgi:hypothetical protein
MLQPYNNGLFVPTSYVWDISQLQELDVTDPQFKELIVRLYQNIADIATALNLKDSAYYYLGEFVNGQQYFPNPALTSQTASTARYRQVTRLVVNFGALPNAAGTKSVPHGLTPTTSWSFTRIYATTSDPVNFVYLPIPYASSVANDNIELSVDATNVNITVGKDRSAFTITYVVLEFLKI